jgi:hypothetical protein
MADTDTSGPGTSDRANVVIRRPSAWAVAVTGNVYHRYRMRVRRWLSCSRRPLRGSGEILG